MTNIIKITTKQKKKETLTTVNTNVSNKADLRNIRFA